MGLVGESGDLLPDEQRVLVLAPGAPLLDAPPSPARQGRQGDRAQAQQRRLPRLPALYPQVALERRHSEHPQDGQVRHAVAVDPLVGVVGGRLGVGQRLAVRLLLVGAGPVGSQGQQPQPGHQPLPLLQIRQGADDGDQRV